MSSKLWALVMAGGTGERLWPLSRRKHPKQTLRFGTSHSLLQVTVERLQKMIPAQRIVVVTTKRQEKIIRKQLPHLPKHHILLEPASRNTAAAIGLGTIAILKEDPQAVIVVSPADHVIRPQRRFEETVRKAVELAVSREGLVCIGIKPTYPATGYGYIEPTGKEISPGGYRVQRFLEKPEFKMAQRLIRRPKMVWNSGIFCWKGDVILSAIRQWLPRLYGGLIAMGEAWGRPGADKRLGDLYARLPSISIDVGVLERSRHVWVVPTDFEWDDVGSWNSLAFLHAKDSQGNVALGSHVGYQTDGSILVGQKNHLIATLGLKDLIVVQTKDATLVCHKSHAQDVRRIVAHLSASPKLRRYL